MTNTNKSFSLSLVGLDDAFNTIRLYKCQGCVQTAVLSGNPFFGGSFSLYMIGEAFQRGVGVGNFSRFWQNIHP